MFRKNVKISKRAGALLAVVCLSMGTLVAAATTFSVGGGTWSYGVGSTVWSNYHHPSKIHGSSVVNGNGVTDTDYNRQPGETSHASATAVDGKTDHAYYCIGQR